MRLATLGTAATTRMEIGSITKALTGLVIADSIERGELSLDAPVETYLSPLRGSPAGTVSIRELVTHRSGYADFGAATLRRAAWSAPTGRNWIDTDLAQLMREVRSGDLATRGSYAYSTLGAATAGQAAAAAAGLDYPDLMRTRLFEPLGMTDSAIQIGQPLVEDGKTASGLSVRPWIFDGYAPAGAAVSTLKDLSILATALLDGTAPGMDALTATASTDQGNTGIGDFWRVSRWHDRSDHHLAQRPDRRLHHLPRAGPAAPPSRHRAVRRRGRPRHHQPRHRTPRPRQVDRSAASPPGRGRSGQGQSGAGAR